MAARRRVHHLGRRDVTAPDGGGEVEGGAASRGRAARSADAELPGAGEERGGEVVDRGVGDVRRSAGPARDGGRRGRAGRRAGRRRARGRPAAARSSPRRAAPSPAAPRAGCDSATTSKRRPTRRRASAMTARVCDPAGRSPTGPNRSAAPRAHRRGASTLSGSSSRAWVLTPVGQARRSRRRRRGRARREPGAPAAAATGRRRGGGRRRVAARRWRAQHVGEVVRGGGVDHAEPHRARRARAAGGAASGPGRGWRRPWTRRSAGRGRGRRRRHPAATVALEQRDAEPALQLGDALRQRRRRHADGGRGLGPGVVAIDGHQVLELLDGEVEAGGGPGHDPHVSSVFLNRCCVLFTIVHTGPMTARDIAPATGKLGVLLPGLGAVASTFIAGVLAARQSGVAPIGSLTPDGPHPPRRARARVATR